MAITIIIKDNIYSAFAVYQKASNTVLLLNPLTTAHTARF